MPDESEEIFNNYLDTFRLAAAKIFADHPSLRSVILGVSQYWADEADDAVHSMLVASERAIPVWPHYCAESTYDESDETENIPGEVCSNCGELPWLESWDDNGEAVVAFEAWCHEAGSQEQPEQENALPCVLARKVGDAIEISMVGRIERIHTVLSQFDDADDRPDPMWKDPRALELYDQVSEHALDDGPRRVLADYLLERNLPRGEFIASSLADANSDVVVRRDNLLAEHRRSWLFPLGNDVPIATAVFRRGFLAEADVCSTHPEHRGHPVWRTVERLRVCGGDSVLHPNMRALREVGPCDGTWLDALAAATRPWAIEKLDAVVDTERAIDQLRELTTMPALRELTLRGEHIERAAAALVIVPEFGAFTYTTGKLKLVWLVTLKTSKRACSVCPSRT